MTTNYNVDRTKNLINAFGVSFCDSVYSATLAANTNETIAVPLTAAFGAPTAYSKNKFLAVVSVTPGTDTFIALNTAALKPAAGTFGATHSELIPNGCIAKTVQAGDTINIKSTGTPDVTVAFYAIQE